MLKKKKINKKNLRNRPNLKKGVNTKQNPSNECKQMKVIQKWTLGDVKLKKL